MYCGSWINFSYGGQDSDPLDVCFLPVLGVGEVHTEFIYFVRLRFPRMVFSCLVPFRVWLLLLEMLLLPGLLLSG